MSQKMIEFQLITSNYIQKYTQMEYNEKTKDQFSNAAEQYGKRKGKSEFAGRELNSNSRYVSNNDSAKKNQP